MKKFRKSELDRFNDRLQNVLENKDCVGIFERFLSESRKELYKVFILWSKAHMAKEHKGSVTDSMYVLMEEIDGFNMVEDGNLDDIMNQCCDILDPKVKEDFMEYLHQRHTQ